MYTLIYNRMIVMIATVVILLLNVLHPFLHFLEGGSLDASLPYMNAWAALALNEQQ